MVAEFTSRSSLARGLAAGGGLVGPGYNPGGGIRGAGTGSTERSPQRDLPPRIGRFRNCRDYQTRRGVTTGARRSRDGGQWARISGTKFKRVRTLLDAQGLPPPRGRCSLPRLAGGHSGEGMVGRAQGLPRFRPAGAGAVAGAAAQARAGRAGGRGPSLKLRQRQGSIAGASAAHSRSYVQCLDTARS